MLASGIKNASPPLCAPSPPPFPPSISTWSQLFSHYPNRISSLLITINLLWFFFTLFAFGLLHFWSSRPFSSPRPSARIAMFVRKVDTCTWLRVCTDTFAAASADDRPGDWWGKESGANSLCRSNAQHIGAFSQTMHYDYVYNPRSRG